MIAILGTLRWLEEFYAVIGYLQYTIRIAALQM